MNLLDKAKKQTTTSTPGERQALTTPDKVLEKERARKAQYQRENRQIHMDVWKNEKARIDQLDENGLVDYIEKNEHKAHDTRAGLFSMKINPYEHALMKLAFLVSGAKTAKDFFLSYVRSVIKNRKSES